MGSTKGNIKRESLFHGLAQFERGLVKIPDQYFVLAGTRQVKVAHVHALKGRGVNTNVVGRSAVYINVNTAGCLKSWGQGTGKGGNR